MAIEVRTLTGDFLFLGGAVATAYLVVTPIATVPADATQGVLTRRPKRWDIVNGILEDGAELYGGTNYSFLVRDVREKDILYFEAGVSNVAGDVSVESLYLTATTVAAIGPNYVLEGDDVTVLAPPSGATEGHALTIGIGGTLEFAAVSGTSSTTLTVTAGATLSGRRVVALNGSGEAIYADKDTANQQSRILGLTAGAVSIGEAATIQTAGTITEATWAWNVLLPIYLGTNGALTQTLPTSGAVVQVAVPLTATTIAINIQLALTRA